MEAKRQMSIVWTIIGAASPRWAEKVCSDAATPEEATELLWEAIAKTTRIEEPDPEAAWKAHEEKLREKAAWLNNEQFEERYYMAPGTDLEAGLPKNHIWEGAGAFNPRGEEFMANMPTEEVATAPDCWRIDGTVAQTKPLVYGGNILEDMHFTAKDGQVVEAHAKQGDDVLQNLLKTPGARL